MRTPAEIIFRLRQEAANIFFWLMPPSAPDPSGALPLPSARTVAAALQKTFLAKNVSDLAAQIRAHSFPLLGLTLDTGPEIHWRRDYINNKETGPDYFRLVPYLDPQRAGDHKIIWELNRHQHLVLLAQAYLFDGDQANLDEIFRQFESWEGANPYQCGINWASTLEVAFRALSWLWLLHLIGDQIPGGLRSRFITSLYRHAKHIENNLSFYFSPNTHLLGEAVALNALGRIFPEFRDLGRHVVREQMDKQVRDDGSHFEQSTYYHVYALDMFLFHAIVEDVTAAYRSKLERMAEFLFAIQGPQRSIPFIGDDDGGRFFHPFGQRDRFGRATMATCSVFFNRPEWLGEPDDLQQQAAWWLGVHALQASPATATLTSQLFKESGLAVMTAADRHIVIDAGPFGPWGSGHSHSDTLSITVRAGDNDILIDPGTYTYMGHERNSFRGSIAHNTIRIDQSDQAIPVNAFRWTDQPSVQLQTWESSHDEDRLIAECAYRGFTHRRTVRFLKPSRIELTDEVSGPSGPHDIEQLWQLGTPDVASCFSFDCQVERLESWRSDAFGSKHPSTVLRIHRKTELPVKLETTIHLK